MANYNHTIKINDKPLVFQKEISDPFVRVEVSISMWDRLKTIFKKDFRVTVMINGDHDTIGKVMNLDRADWTNVWEPGGSSSVNSNV